MALDWGVRRVGIAVSDELGIAAHGLPTLVRKNVRRDLDALTNLIRKRGITTVIVGKPLHLDGSESRSSGLAFRFARRLAKHANVDVKLWDERLTSWEAENLIGPSPKSSGATDQMAAILLLESFLAANAQ
jgi:putative Holliday junction resolvase